MLNTATGDLRQFYVSFDPTLVQDAQITPDLKTTHCGLLANKTSVSVNLHSISKVCLTDAPTVEKLLVELRKQLVNQILNDSSIKLNLKVGTLSI